MESRIVDLHRYPEEATASHVQEESVVGIVSGKRRGCGERPSGSQVKRLWSWPLGRLTVRLSELLAVRFDLIWSRFLFLQA